jgi:hypothetical protein
MNCFIWVLIVFLSTLYILANWFCTYSINAPMHAWVSLYREELSLVGLLELLARKTVFASLLTFTR